MQLLFRIYIQSPDLLISSEQRSLQSNAISNTLSGQTFYFLAKSSRICRILLITMHITFSLCFSINLIFQLLLLSSFNFLSVFIYLIILCNKKIESLQLGQLRGTYFFYKICCVSSKLLQNTFTFVISDKISCRIAQRK